MLLSSTVQNYLKVIYLQQLILPSGQSLVPMGLLATSLRITPGTTTTMVKSLADSGLVLYEPYSGVRLTTAGEKLAALVIRRHRLVELFLVQVMGMSWDEVHDEAEQLEHVVSDRLIERIDEMLGHPEVDPHGDPIPNAEGSMRHQELSSLLTCPLNTPVTVSRVADQDAAFLRFLEISHLKPGQQIEVESRDMAADCVSVKSRSGDRLTIGARAASKLLVDVVALVLAVIALTGSPAFAQSPQEPTPARSDSSRPFEITDNSFFVEEAFNQEPGIFQNIFVVLHSGETAWSVGFTQEWPVVTQRHQFSYTVAGANISEERGFGDVLLNYRFQAMLEGPGRPAFSPRVSLVFPTGDAPRGLGSGGVGLQLNMPFSKQVENFFFHWNAGITIFPGVETDHFPSTGLLPADNVSLVSPFFSASTIYRLRPMLNLMMEAVVDLQESPSGPGITDRQNVGILSPGVRGGWNVGDQQIVVGAAVPVYFGREDTNVGIFGYFSYELPFKK
jgi:DtxR family transcriptional regulator, Mn-dependent transcriptional regulator